MIIFNIPGKVLWKKCVIIKSNVFVALDMLILKSSRMHDSYRYLVCQRLRLYFEKLLLWKGVLQTFVTITCLVLRKRTTNKIFSISLGKKVLLYLTYVTSNAASYTSSISVPITFEQLVARYLDFWLKNSFVKFRFRYSNNSAISTFNYISNVIYFWKKSVKIQVG